MIKSKDSKTSILYRMVVSLKGSTPAIWRSLLVPADYTLDKVAVCILTAMGWSNSHLHSFRQGQNEYLDTSEDDCMDNEDVCETLEESKYTLKDLVDNKEKIEFEYDFGDCWMHEILISEQLIVPAGKKTSVCTGGEYACPPDDCGGIDGYYRMLDILSDPEHEEFEEMSVWLGDKFDMFSLNTSKINKSLEKFNKNPAVAGNESYWTGNII
ncbi:MAG: hypothetical protein A2452_04490 [Candidatus Firestonebacteria bacterium RIFOXYC2_FULL_39_67]|nr:MAG: hypothetical protein A2536_10605 [Candidatus Firestonebacteria bacterium RIFOXYD2_FULL_39_29]OGF57639.1 MAG: hypothetical protein A2452_04490 [Candidatus Firestonebacteria bacterium RIFOXYC2_FULL_39_67]